MRRRRSLGGLLARSDNQKIVPAILAPEHPNPQNVVTSYYFSDGQGNVIALVSPNREVLARYEYDPFGNLISKNGPMADMNKYRFSSKEWNDNAGLYYYGYRFYDPNLQRWLNRDPLDDLAADLPHLVSGSLFVGNSVLSLDEPVPRFQTGRLSWITANGEGSHLLDPLSVMPRNQNLFNFVFNDPPSVIDPDGDLPVAQWPGLFPALPIIYRLLIPTVNPEMPDDYRLPINDPPPIVCPSRSSIPAGNGPPEGMPRIRFVDPTTGETVIEENFGMDGDPEIWFSWW